MEWKRILVPHDYSASADHAAVVAEHLAKVHGGKLWLLHVVELPQQSHAALPAGAVEDNAHHGAHEHCDALAERLRAAGIEVTTAARSGSPVDEINRFVAEHGIDAIVMGTHGRTGIRRLIAGSVAERVVRTSTVPVITVRHPGD